MVIYAGELDIKYPDGTEVKEVVPYAFNDNLPLFGMYKYHKDERCIVFATNRGYNYIYLDTGNVMRFDGIQPTKVDCEFEWRPY